MIEILTYTKLIFCSPEGRKRWEPIPVKEIGNRPNFPGATLQPILFTLLYASNTFLMPMPVFTSPMPGHGTPMSGGLPVTVNLVCTASKNS